MPKLRECLSEAHRSFFENNLMDFCKRLWNIGERYPHYTKHDLSHSERIEKQIDTWTNNRAWDEHEAFVLLLGIYLHDIGMQSDDIRHLLELEESAPFLTENSLENIRKKHGELSAQMIREVASGGQILANLSVPEATEYTNYFRAAALLAEYHCKDISDFPERHFICHDIYLFNNENECLDLLFLLHVLRVGDSLDAAHDRVNYEWFSSYSSIIGKIKDKYHPLLHEYVSNLHIDPHSIKFSFSIPPGDPGFCRNIAACATKTVRRNKEISEEYLKKYGILFPDIEVICDCNSKPRQNCDWNSEIAEFVQGSAPGEVKPELNCTAYPSIFISSCYDTENQVNYAFKLAQELQKAGLEADMDQFHYFETENEWNHWTCDQVKKCKKVVVILSDRYISLLKGSGHNGSHYGKWESFLDLNELQGLLKEGKLILVYRSDKSRAEIKNILSGRDLKLVGLPAQPTENGIDDLLRCFNNLNWNDYSAGVRRRGKNRVNEAISRNTRFLPDITDVNIGNEKSIPHNFSPLKKGSHNLPKDLALESDDFTDLTDCINAGGTRIQIIGNDIFHARNMTLKTVYSYQKEEAFEAFVWIENLSGICTYCSFLDEIADVLNYRYALENDIPKKSEALLKVFAASRIMVVLNGLDRLGDNPERNHIVDFIRKASSNSVFIALLSNSPEIYPDVFPYKINIGDKKSSGPNIGDWKKLEALQRNILTALSLFPKPVFLTAISNLCGAAPEVIDEEAQLLVVKWQLLIERDLNRESIRLSLPNGIPLDWINEYGAEYSNIRKTCVKYFTGYYKSICLWENKSHQRELFEQWPNIRNVMDICLCLSSEDGSYKADYTDIYLSVQNMLWERGYWQQSMEYAGYAATFCKDLGKTCELIHLYLDSLGWISFNRKEYPAAESYYALAFSNLIPSAQPSLYALYCNYRGRLYSAPYKKNNIAEAKKLYWEGLRYAEDPLIESFLLSALGDIYKSTSDYENAIFYFRCVVEYRKKRNDSFRLCSVLCDIADLKLASGFYRSCINDYNSALKLAEEVDRAEIIARSYRGLAAAHGHEGNDTDAGEYMKKARAIFQSLGITVKEPDYMQKAAAFTPMNEDRLDLLLINAPSGLVIDYDQVQANERDIRLPLGLVSIATYVKKYGLRAKILDAEALGYGVCNIVQIAQEYRPKVIGINCHTINRKIVYEIAKTLQLIMPDSFIVLGGAHPTLAPESTLMELKEYAMKDVVLVIGEGEKVMFELCKRDLNEKADISGICYLQDEVPHRTKESVRIANLDIIGFHDFNTMFINNRLEHYTNYEDAVLKGLWNRTYLQASRGCINSCEFCTQSKIWKGGIRFRSSESIINEMKFYHQNHSIRKFYFYDDNICTWRNIDAFLDEMKKSGQRFEWSCSARIDDMTPERIVRFHEAGCREIAFGIESGSDNIINSINKNWKAIGFDEIKQRFKFCINTGIKPRAHFMIGFPNETKEEIEATVKFSIELRSVGLTDVNFFATKLFPGTGLYENSRNQSQNYDSQWLNDWRESKDKWVQAKLRKYNDVPVKPINSHLTSYSLRCLVRNSYELFRDKSIRTSQVPGRLWKGVTWS